MKPGDFSTDLDLHALAYINAELDEAQVQEFEARLAHDQEAREAVERAVLLGSAVVRDLDRSGTVPSGKVISSSRRFGWRPVALAGAAMLIAAVGISVFLNRGPSVSEREMVATDAEALIASWVELGNLDELAEIGFDEDEADEDLEVPGWLMQAVEEDKDR